MPKKKKSFSKDSLYNTITHAQYHDKSVRSAVLALFEGMETESETKQRKLSEVKAGAKAKANVKAKAIVKASDDAEIKMTAMPGAVAKPKAKAKPTKK